jgi:serine/threonine protein kinase
LISFTNPAFTRFSSFLCHCRDNLRTILDRTTDPFLAESLQRVLTMRIYNISMVITAELSLLHERCAPSDLTNDILTVYLSLSLFVLQLFDIMRQTPAHQRVASHSSLPIVIGKMDYYQEIDAEPTNFICRICGETVCLDLVEEHSALCLSAHQWTYQSFGATAQLAQANQALALRLLDVEFPAAEVAPCILFPALYLYLLVERAINVNCSESDAEEKLETVKAKVLYFALPREFPKGIPLPEIQNAVASKLTAARAIASTVDLLALTTRTRRVSLTGLQASLSDFQFVGRISSGAFARVYLARKKRTSDLVAIKVIKRSHVNLKNQVRKVSIERDIMLKLNNQFMVHFYYSFMQQNNLYLVMEYLPGGDIFSVLQNLGSLPEDAVRTYASEIIKALEFLRERSIIHRDLKPDNLLISESGRLKLVDFGLSYDGMSGSNRPSKVGTPDYMAPEIVLMQPHSFSADYWSLGVILYEMLVGEPPFHGPDPEATFRNIIQRHFDTTALAEFTPECQDFVNRLLCLDPAQRLGSQRFSDIMEHQWFTGINWQRILERPPVFVPDTSGSDAYQHNFVERYRFPDGDERDIREDIEESLAQVPRPSRSASCDAFEQTGLEHLCRANQDHATKLRATPSPEALELISRATPRVPPCTSTPGV